LQSGRESVVIAEPIDDDLKSGKIGEAITHRFIGPEMKQREQLTIGPIL
jgi:hypothetical protein